MVKHILMGLSLDWAFTLYKLGQGIGLILLAMCTNPKGNAHTYSRLEDSYLKKIEYYIFNV